jgi:hypothetical protein
MGVNGKAQFSTEENRKTKSLRWQKKERIEQFLQSAQLLRA